MAFHRYPQLIQQFFNTDWFGPPRNVSCASPCPWIDHLVSGLWHATQSPYSDSLSLRLHRLRFNLATYHNSPVHYARGTPSPITHKGHRAPTGCRHTVSGTISLPFRGTFHLSLTVLVHYRSLRVLSLRGWSPRIRTGYHVSRGTWDSPSRLSSFAYGAITLCGSSFQTSSARRQFCNSTARP